MSSAVSSNNPPNETAATVGGPVALRANPNGMLFVAAADHDGGVGLDGRGLNGFSNRTGASSTPQPVATANFVFNGSTFDRNKKPSTVSRIVSSAATTNATSAKASAGEVHTVTATNTTASVKFLKLYNKASAPTVGTDTPFMTIALPVSNAAYVLEFPNGGLYFSTGIAYALTGAAADADTTALASGDVVGLNITYS